MYGQVFGEGQDLSEALVTIPELGIVAAANGSGTYAFSAPPGTHDVGYMHRGGVGFKPDIGISENKATGPVDQDLGALSFEHGDLVVRAATTDGRSERLTVSVRDARTGMPAGDSVSVNGAPVALAPGPYLVTVHDGDTAISMSRLVFVVPTQRNEARFLLPLGPQPGADPNDWDGDGVPNSVDAEPHNGLAGADSDKDGLPDNLVAGFKNPPKSLDPDNDSVADPSDNCPLVPNPGQIDNDGDGKGDACDDDDDNDTVLDVNDNCPLVANQDQKDSDMDGVGDACAGDRDGDGIADLDDNCPGVSNPGQTDTDNDGVGDACQNAGAPCEASCECDEGQRCSQGRCEAATVLLANGTYRELRPTMFFDGTSGDEATVRAAIKTAMQNAQAGDVIGVAEGVDIPGAFLETSGVSVVGGMERCEDGTARVQPGAHSETSGVLTVLGTSTTPVDDVLLYGISSGHSRISAHESRGLTIVDLYVNGDQPNDHRNLLFDNSINLRIVGVRFAGIGGGGGPGGQPQTRTIELQDSDGTISDVSVDASYASGSPLVKVFHPPGPLTVERVAVPAGKFAGRAVNVERALLAPVTLRNISIMSGSSISSWIAATEVADLTIRDVQLLAGGSSSSYSPVLMSLQRTSASLEDVSIDLPKQGSSATGISSIDSLGFTANRVSVTGGFGITQRGIVLERLQAGATIMDSEVLLAAADDSFTGSSWALTVMNESANAHEVRVVDSTFQAGKAGKSSYGLHLISARFRAHRSTFQAGRSSEAGNYVSSSDVGLFNCYLHGGDGYETKGLSVNGTSQVVVEASTLEGGNGSSASYGIQDNKFGTGVQEIELRNSIVGAGSGSQFAVLQQNGTGAPSFSTSSRNNYFWHLSLGNRTSLDAALTLTGQNGNVNGQRSSCLLSSTGPALDPQKTGCINAGGPIDNAEARTTEIRGLPRLVGAAADIGAFEVQ